MVSGFFFITFVPSKGVPVHTNVVRLIVYFSVCLYNFLNNVRRIKDIGHENNCLSTSRKMNTYLDDFKENAGWIRYRKQVIYRPKFETGKRRRRMPVQNKLRGFSLQANYTDQAAPWFTRPKPLLFHSNSSSIILTRLSGPRFKPTISQKIW
jgi:hypothetical protein